jgi:hypothetical protein
VWKHVKLQELDWAVDMSREAAIKSYNDLLTPPTSGKSCRPMSLPD